jgi:hypothetical protein
VETAVRLFADILGVVKRQNDRWVWCAPHPTAVVVVGDVVDGSRAPRPAALRGCEPSRLPHPGQNQHREPSTGPAPRRPLPLTHRYPPQRCVGTLLPPAE